MRVLGKRERLDEVAVRARNIHLLVVEDDLRLAQLLAQELGHEGYRVTAVHKGADALSRVASERFDLVILDLNLPDMDGIAVAERLRDHDVSVLMLTARGDVASRVKGLYAGASDYLSKPFSVQELLARVHVRLRERLRPSETLAVGDLELDPAAGVCSVSGAPLPLTAQEFRLLELLLRNRGRIFSKGDLETRLYGPETLPGSNTVEVFVSNLRKKLAAAGVEGLINTVRGMGYVVRS